jgi:hypothetical protein
MKVKIDMYEKVVAELQSQGIISCDDKTSNGDYKITDN